MRYGRRSMRPRPENAFREPGERRLGLIDWEQVPGGDPVLDIVKAEGRFLGRPDIPERVSGRDVPRGGGGVRGVGAPGGRT